MRVLKYLSILLPLAAGTAAGTHAGGGCFAVCAAEAAGTQGRYTSVSSVPEDVKPIFCDALKDPAMYEQHKFESYKMLIGGHNGWIFRSETDFRTDFSLSPEAVDNLKEMNDIFRRRGMELVILLTPTRAMMHPAHIPADVARKYKFGDGDAAWKSYEKTVAEMRKLGIDVVSIERPKAEQPFFYKRDHHWNPDGAHAAARAVAAHVKRMPQYETIPRMKFATEELGPFDLEGVSKKVFKKLCNTEQPTEAIVKTSTQRADTAAAQSDLFGDTAEPEIVLLGTSNSTMEPSFSNFEGFLKEALGADVLNMSVSGGGLDTAMIAYLNSEHYRKKPAKIAIWELPSYYDISKQMNFFREALPAAYGLCDGKTVAERKGVPVDDKSIVALDKLGGKKISGGNYYLSLDFDTPVGKSFVADLRYEKNRDRFRFQRGGRIPSDETFFVSLRDDKKEYLNKVILTVPEEIQGKKVDVRLCRKKENEKGFRFFR